MKKIIMHRLFLVIRFLIVSFVGCSFATIQAKDILVCSPDSTVTVTVGVSANKPFYKVNYNKAEIISPSHLGFQLDHGNMGDYVKLTGKGDTRIRLAATSRP